MIKCRAIKSFSLKEFDKLEDVKRKAIEEYGKIHVGDTFKCSEEMASYLSGNNHLKEVVVKILEVEPRDSK